MEYKCSSGITSNLHRHLHNKHTTKLDVENKNKGSMDKFVNAIPVSFEFLYYFFLYIIMVLIKKFIGV